VRQYFHERCELLRLMILLMAHDFCQSGFRHRSCLIPKGARSGLPTRTAATESVSFCAADEKLTADLLPPLYLLDGVA
jgi:hypothetical protein